MKKTLPTANIWQLEKIQLTTAPQWLVYSEQ